MHEFPHMQEYVDYVIEHKQLYYRLAYSFMGNEADSMDAISQLMLTVLEKGQTLREPGAFAAWSKKVLANICRSRLKEQKRRELPLELPLELAAAETKGLSSEDALSIREAVQALPDAQRDVIILRYHLNYEYKEIAAMLDLPQGTIKSRLHRAVKQLQQFMGVDLPEPEPSLNGGGEAS